MAKRATPQAHAQDTPTAPKPGTHRVRGPDAGSEAPAETAPTPTSQTYDEKLQSMSMGSEPSEEDIRMRAYHRYLERGAGHGMDFEDWLEAEREIKLKEKS